MQLSPQLANNVVNCINGYFDEYMNHAVRSGRIDTYTAQSIALNMKQAANTILNSLVTAYQYQPEIPYAAIRDATFNYANNYMTSYMQQRQGQQNFMPGGGGGINLTGGENIQSVFGSGMGGSGRANITIGGTSNEVPIRHEPIQETKKSHTGKLNAVIFADQGSPFDTVEDHDAPSYSTSYESWPILDVTEKCRIKRPNPIEEFNYFRCISHIPEPCVKQVINNFYRTNARLYGSGQWIADIDYHQFILEGIANPHSPTPIDRSMLDDPTATNFSVDKRISSVIDSICMMNYSAVEKISNIIITEFNTLLKQYVRLSKHINEIIQIDDLKDLNTLASLRLAGTHTMQHPAYERAIFHCFRTVIDGIVTNKTNNGMYATGDILPHLLASPRFAVRDVGLCERYMPYDDEKFIEAVALRYTAFANNRNIVICNFIPEGLEEDVEGGNVVFANKGNFNIIEHLLTKVWGSRSKVKTIVMVDKSSPERKLTLKTGVTLDDELFLFKDNNFDEYYGYNSK